MLTIDEAKEVKSFIRSEREALLREILEEVEKMKIPEEHCSVADDAVGSQHRAFGSNRALSAVQELIKKKI